MLENAGELTVVAQNLGSVPLMLVTDRPEGQNECHELNEVAAFWVQDGGEAKHGSEATIRRRIGASRLPGHLSKEPTVMV